MLPSPSFLRVLALQRKEETKGDGNIAVVAFFAALHCSAAPQEPALQRNVAKEEQQEGDSNIAAITFFFAHSCAAEKRRKRRTRRRCLHQSRVGPALAPTTIPLLQLQAPALAME
jgi:hypothetical protein